MLGFETSLHIPQAGLERQTFTGVGVRDPTLHIDATVQMGTTNDGEDMTGSNEVIQATGGKFCNANGNRF